MRTVFTVFGTLSLLVAGAIFMLTPLSSRDIALYQTIAGGLALIGIGWMVGAVAYRPDPPRPPVPLPAPMPAPGWPAPQAAQPPVQPRY